MKKLFIAFFTLALICVSVFTVLGAGTDERISMDKAKWERFNTSSGEDSTLQFSKDTMKMGKDAGSYIMKYDKMMTNSKVRFLFKYENSTAETNDLIAEFYLRDTVPEKGLWDIEDCAYGVRFAQNDVGTKAFFSVSKPGIPNNFVRHNNGSMIIKDFKKNEIVQGKFHELVIGAVNENGNVRLTFSIDGVEYINMLDAGKNKITEGGYFCIVNSAKADITIKLANEKPVTTKSGKSTTTEKEQTTQGTRAGESSDTSDTSDTSSAGGSASETEPSETAASSGPPTSGTTESGKVTEVISDGIPGGITALIIGETVLLLAALGFGAYFFIIYKKSQG